MPESTDELAARYQHLQSRVDELVAAIAALVARGGPTAAIARLTAELVAVVDAESKALDEHAHSWLAAHLVEVYVAGAVAAGFVVVWSDRHLAAATQVGRVVLADLRGATAFLRRDARSFRARARAAAALTVAEDDAGVARRAERTLVERGVRAVRYSNGARQPIDAYAHMVLRSATTRAVNLASLEAARAGGIGWVRVTDGPACGWRSHDDPDLADGTLRTLDDAEAHLLSHPNCRRRLHADPTIATNDQAVADMAATRRTRETAAIHERRAEKARNSAARRQRALAARQQRRLQARSAARRRRAG